MYEKLANPHFLQMKFMIYVPGGQKQILLNPLVLHVINTQRSVLLINLLFDSWGVFIQAAKNTICVP